MAEENPAGRAVDTKSPSVKPERRRARKVIVLLALAAVLIGACTVLLYSAMSNRNTGQSGTANNVLSSGKITSHSADTTHDRLGLSGQLVNNSASELKTNGLIEISDPDIASGVEVLYAQLAQDPSAIVGIPTQPPAEVTIIPPREHVEAVVGLEIDCTEFNDQSVWPSAQTKASLEVHGFEKPATFMFSDIFGIEAADQIRELCASNS